jgi:hypothetical protein
VEAGGFSLIRLPAGFEGPTARQRDLVFRLPFNLTVDSFGESDLY